MHDVGKIGVLGLTAVGDTAALQAVIGTGLFGSAQVTYNMLNPSAGAVLPANYPAQDYGRLFDWTQRAGTGVVTTFRPDEDLAPAVARLAEHWPALRDSARVNAAAPAALLESVSARELTRRQCQVFELAAARRTPQGIPCTE